MNLKIFTVYDSKVEAYLQPFFMRSKGEALRAWTASIADEKTGFHTNPEDYTLFEIGDYDDKTAKISTHLTPISLGTALEHKRISNTFPTLLQEGASV